VAPFDRPLARAPSAAPRPGTCESARAQSDDLRVWQPVQPIWYFFGVARSSAASGSAVARTIRFTAGLKQKIATDAERCGRSFEGQVIALLRRHYGEDVDISPSPVEILALAAASMADIPAADARLIERKLKASDR
jgi:hypothetical protein